MSDVLERFMRYVQVCSQSDGAHADVTPSTPAQHDMARLLGQELEGLGLERVVVDEHAYVTGSLPASAGAEDKPAILLCAHLDTSEDSPGAGVRPHVVHYEGGPLVAGVVDGKPVQTTPEELPDLAKFRGQDIVCSDGTTLLGADDKAGVAEIVALLARLVADPMLPHPAIRVAFVPDEEIGHGAALLDVDAVDADCGYTVDGGELGGINCECFYAGSTQVEVRGVMGPLGYAKGSPMLNAAYIACEFQQMVPQAERAEHSEGREGYCHLASIEGSVTEAHLHYLMRDFDASGLAAREDQLRSIAAFLNQRYGEGTVRVNVTEQYHNMAEKLVGKEYIVERAMEANREVGIQPCAVPVRGGTDGAELTFRGLPCPNLATGGYNFHTVWEFIPVASMEKTVDMLEHLVAKFA